MYKIEKLILEKRFRDKVPFKEARKEVYLAHPDLTHKIPRLTKKTNPPPLEKRVTQSGMTYSQATSPNPDATKEPAITKATQDMIEALILTVEKQQEQIALLIGELTDMKSLFEAKPDSTSASQKTKPHNCEMETQTPSYQKVTNDTATQTKTCLHNSTETQTPYFNPTAPISPSSLSFLTETKIDETPPSLSESMNYDRENTSKRKRLSPIEAPRCPFNDSNSLRENMSFTSIDEPKEASPPLRKGPRNRTSSDSVIDYHEYRNQEVDRYMYPCGNAHGNRDPEVSSSLPSEENDELDTDDTEDHQEQPEQDTPSKAPEIETPQPGLTQAYFFSKELARNMNATEIKESFNKDRGNKNVVCSVLQLKKPYGGHHIFFHTYEGRFTLPFELRLFKDIRVSLEIPRNHIFRVCDCQDVHMCSNVK